MIICAYFARIVSVETILGMIMNLNEKCLLKFLKYPDELVEQTNFLVQILSELEKSDEQQ